MNNDLITYMSKLQKDRDSEIYSARDNVKLLQQRMNNFDKMVYSNIEDKIKEQELLIDGYRAAYKELFSLKKQVLENKYNMHTNDVNHFLTNIDMGINNYIKALKVAYNKLYELRVKKDVSKDKNSVFKHTLEKEFQTLLKTASDLTEDEFIKELYLIFRNNDFNGCYDIKDARLHYSLGQIFILKYTLKQILKYTSDDSIYLNLKIQKDILDTYEFSCRETYISNKDFIINLRNGNINMCNLDKNALSYEGATKLYRKIFRSFNLPRIASYTLRRIR